MAIAFLFPGQGAQTPGFLARLPAHPRVQAALDEASAVLGRDARTLDTPQALASTVGMQLSGLVAGVAVMRALEAEGVEADAVAGMSSGAYTAAVACGAIEFRDALKLLELRARLMAEAYPHGYGLAAIVGLHEDRVRRLVAELDSPAQPLFLANLNAPTQFVLAGSDSALDQAIVAARQAGAGKALRMSVSVPSHCALMEGVATRLQAALAHVKLSPARIPYMGNVGARALRDPLAIGLDLATNVARPVHWHDATSVLFEMGIRCFFEFPPGSVLTGLVHEAFDSVQARSLADTPLETVLYLAARSRRED